MSMTSVLLKTLLFTVGLLRAGADPDLTVCNPAEFQPYNGPALPYLPNHVTWRIELNIVDKNETVDIQQYFDYDNNRYAEHNFRKGVTSRQIFKYDTNEVATITFATDKYDPNGASCQITQLSTSPFVKIVGDKMVNGKLHVDSPMESLRLNATRPIRFMGPQTLSDGVKVNWWQGCIYQAGSQTTILVNWYFNNPNTWLATRGRWSFPVVMSVQGTTPDTLTGLPRMFNHQYNFADARPYLTQGHVGSFQIPIGVYCKNDATSVSLPQVPTHFSLKSELIDGVNKYINWVSEYFDADLNLTRYDYQNPVLHTYGNRTVSRVHDFNTGIAYIMDPARGNCTISTIKQSGIDDKDIGINVRIRTPKEFLYLDTNWEYVGQRVERGIKCDVWVTQRNDWPPPGPSFTTIWEYYFSAGVIESVGTSDPFSVPVKLKVTARNPPINMTYNFYEFDPDRSGFHDYDIGQCFNSSMRAEFLMVVPGNHRRIVWLNSVVFKRLFIISVSSTALVSPLRVTNVQISFNSTGLLLTFSLLDNAEMIGDVSNPSKAPKLDAAIANLKSSLDDGSFTIYVQDPALDGGFDNLYPSSYSFTRGPPLMHSAPHLRRRRDTKNSHVTKIHFQNKSDKGMTSGALAGLAVGLLLGGFLVGLLVFIAIFKMKQGSNAPQSFVNPVNE